MKYLVHGRERERERERIVREMGGGYGSDVSMPSKCRPSQSCSYCKFR